MAANDPNPGLNTRLPLLRSLVHLHGGTWSLTASGLQASETTFLSNAENLKKFMRLPQNGQLIAEYIWIDSEGGTRSKSRVSLFVFFSFAHCSATLFHGPFCPSSLSAHPRIHYTISQSTRSPTLPSLLVRNPSSQPRRRRVRRSPSPFPPIPTLFASHKTGFSLS